MSVDSIPEVSNRRPRSAPVYHDLPPCTMIVPYLFPDLTMSSIRFGATHEFQFLRREDVRTRWTLESALDFLRRFHNDTAALAGFRRLARSQGRGSAMATGAASAVAANDQQLFQTIARMMVSGELLLVKPHGLIDHGHLSLKVTSDPVAVAPPPAAKVPELVDEDNTFDTDHDGVAQAAVLRAAALHGVPFCAECERAASPQSPPPRRPPPHQHPNP